MVELVKSVTGGAATVGGIVFCYVEKSKKERDTNSCGDYVTYQ